MLEKHLETGVPVRLPCVQANRPASSLGRHERKMWREKSMDCEQEVDNYICGKIISRGGTKAVC